MFCIKCQSKDISVINSRPSKKVPSIWRRRQCKVCGFTFTTREELAAEDLIQIGNTPFSTPRLALSIAPLLPQDDDAADDAFWLAKTIYEFLIKHRRYTVSVGELKLTTRDVLHRFNPAVAIQYELKHKIVEASAKPRRGRPRLKR